MLALLEDFAVNLVANVVVALLFGWIAVARVRRRRNHGVREFFGFEPDEATLRILLSSIAVNVAGTSGTGEIAQGFHGDAITEVEYRHALNLAEAVERSSGSWFVSTLLGTRAGADPLSTQITESPSLAHVYSDVDGSVTYDSRDVMEKLHNWPCTIVVGAPIYNLATFYLMTERCNKGEGSTRFTFLREKKAGGARRGVRYHLSEKRSIDFWRSETDAGGVEDYYVVEKLTSGSSTVFICAGTCTAATAAALDQLRNWTSLLYSYGSEDFGMLYSWSSGDGQSWPAKRREGEPSSGTSTFILDYPARSLRGVGTPPRARWWRRRTDRARSDGRIGVGTTTAPVAPSSGVVITDTPMPARAAGND